ESSFNLGQAMEYENTVNSVAFEGALEGEVKCSIIQPSSAYDSLTTLVPIDYTFDFKSKTIWGDAPWHTVHADQDSYAQAGGIMRRIVTASGEPVTNVPLNGEGAP